jgi:hypothetical protein
MKNLLQRTYPIMPKLYRPPTRLFTTKVEKQPNIIQMMPEYQKALELAVNKKYPEALDSLKESVKQVE